jgi:thiol-disulfide isomerase/thioredoxin
MKYFAGRQSESAQSVNHISSIIALVVFVTVALLAGCSPNSPTPIPAAVADFGAPLEMPGSVLLRWSAPSTVSGAEPVSYVMRYSMTVMHTSDDWDNATNVTDLPAPAGQGTVQQIEVAGLTPNTDYYFAMRVTGRNGQISQFSAQILTRPIDTLTLGSYQLSDLADSLHSSSEWLGHRLTLLNFWGVWCHWCVVEMPDLKTLYSTYVDSDVVMIGLDYGDSRSSLGTFIAANSIPWTNLLGTNQLLADFNIGGYPTTAFFDSNGKLLGVRVGSGSYEMYRGNVEYLLEKSATGSPSVAKGERD